MRGHHLDVLRRGSHRRKQADSPGPWLTGTGPLDFCKSGVESPSQQQSFGLSTQVLQAESVVLLTEASVPGPAVQHCVMDKDRPEPRPMAGRGSRAGNRHLHRQDELFHTFLALVGSPSVASRLSLEHLQVLFPGPLCQLSVLREERQLVPTCTDAHCDSQGSISLCTSVSL